jgi:hypothetical protein
MPSGAAVGGYGDAGNNPPPAGSDAARAAEPGKKEKDSGGNKWVRVSLYLKLSFDMLLTSHHSCMEPVVQQQVSLVVLF